MQPTPSDMSYPNTIDKDPQGASLPSHPARTITRSEPKYDELRPMFGWIDETRIKQTFQVTTQMGRLPAGEHMYRTYKAANPALNVHRRNEDLATDTIFASVPAVDSGGVEIAQFFYGCTSHVTDVKPMKFEKQFVNTLEDMIRERGAPNRLISDM